MDELNIGLQSLWTQLTHPLLLEEERGAHCSTIFTPPWHHPGVVIIICFLFISHPTPIL